MFRLSIRELLLVVAIAALTAGWFLDRSNLAMQLEVLRFEFASWKLSH